MIVIKVLLMINLPSIYIIYQIKTEYVQIISDDKNELFPLKKHIIA